MEPENHMFEKENHLPNHPFSGAMLVSGRVVVNNSFIIRLCFSS